MKKLVPASTMARLWLVVATALAAAVGAAIACGGEAEPQVVTQIQTVVVEKQVPGERVVETVIVEKPVTRTEKVIETVVVEKQVTVTEKVVETVVVERQVEGQTVRVVETVVVERPVTRTERVIETVVVEKQVRVLATVVVEKTTTEIVVATAVPVNRPSC